MKKILPGLLMMLLSATLFAGEPLMEGSDVPAFNLQDQNGEWHTQADYRGQWLAVYFYPKDDTPGCTKEACNFRDNIYAFKAIDAAVVGISVDDVESHKKFSEKYKLPFTLLADPTGETAKSFGVLKDYKLMKLASRQSFLINPDGKIAKHYADVDPDTHTEEVLADIKVFSEVWQSTL